MCPIVDGMAVNAANENAQKLDKVGDDTATNKITLSNSDSVSGASVVNIQREHNSIASFIGKALNAVYNLLPTWSTNNRGLSTDTLFTRINNVDAAFDKTTGHKHDGTTGSGGPIASTGGGGGGSLVWTEVVPAAMPLVENSNLVHLYTAAGTQYLYTTLRLPTSYAGGQVKLKLPVYSADSSGTVLLTTVATLIRTGTDLITSTTNQRTSTNTAITLSAGTVNIPQAVIFDLTDTSGAINSVTCSPGDTIQVSMTRGSDSATSDLRALAYDSEVTFA